MKYFVHTILVLLFSITSATAQTYWINKTPFLDSLYRWNGNIADISNNGLCQFLPVYINKMVWNQYLIKDNKGLYIRIDGTGRVYKATKTTKDQICFTRIDSTFFLGYNSGAINFSFRDTLFSLGGEGFWQTNGHLRYFEEGKEWKAFENKEIFPTVRYLYNYLPNDGHLYYVQFTNYDNYTNSINKRYSIVDVDLKNKKNQLIGSLNPILQTIPYEIFHINSTSLNGTIIKNVDNQSYFLLKFKENKIFKLINFDILDKINSHSLDPCKNLFEMNGHIFYTCQKDSTIQSFEISMKDFKEEPYPLYFTTTNNKSKFSYSLIIVLLIIVLFIMSYYKFFKKMKNVKNDTINDSINQDNNELDFNEIELTIIKQLFNCSKNGKTLGVEELNNLMGVSRKSLEIQKKIRTESINRINHKFKLLTDAETDLIERIRSEEDRRFYRYTVNSVNAELFKEKVFKK